jgi:hypothetical protein
VRRKLPPGAGLLAVLFLVGSALGKNWSFDVSHPVFRTNQHDAASPQLSSSGTGGLSKWQGRPGLPGFFIFQEVFSLKVLLFYYCGKAKDLLATLKAARRTH